MPETHTHGLTYVDQSIFDEEKWQIMARQYEQRKELHLGRFSKNIRLG
jgi:hypothetical protein